MEDRFKSAVEAASTPVYVSGYTDVREAYRAKYGEKTWIGKYIDALGLRTSGVKAKDDKPYLAARRSIERAEKGVNKSSSYASTKEANKAGEKLPPISRAPKGDVTLHIKGNQKTGKGGTRERNITVKMSGDEAYTWVNNPTWETMWDYGDYGYAFDEDGEYALTEVSITA